MSYIIRNIDNLSNYTSLLLQNFNDAADIAFWLAIVTNLPTNISIRFIHEYTFCSVNTQCINVTGTGGRKSHVRSLDQNKIVAPPCQRLFPARRSWPQVVHGPIPVLHGSSENWWPVTRQKIAGTTRKTAMRDTSFCRLTDLPRKQSAALLWGLSSTLAWLHSTTRGQFLLLSLETCALSLAAFLRRSKSRVSHGFHPLLLQHLMFGVFRCFMFVERIWI